MKTYKAITSYDSLLNFGIWYVGRYIPSRGKLEKMLEKKCENKEWRIQVLTALESYIDDQKNLESRIKSDLERGVPVGRLVSRYLVKGFKKEDILSVIEALPKCEVGRFDQIEKKIERMIASGKSRKVAETELKFLYREFEEEIIEAIELRFPSDEEQLTEYYEKYRGKADKKAFDSLVRRGFSYESVKKWVGNIMEE